MLPKGKLKSGEDAQAGAQREAMEETGCVVMVEKFLGSMSHAERGKLKVAQFWKMRTTGEPVRKLKHDVTAVKWLPLEEAIDTLSRPHERAFLASVSQAVLELDVEAAARVVTAEGAAPPVPGGQDSSKLHRFFRAIRTWLRR